MKHVLTYQDAGARRTVQVGDAIEVTLPETATTGFRWVSEVDESALRKLSDEGRAPTVPRGAPGTRVIGYEALRPGGALLRMVKRRAWDDKVSDEFEVRLEVVPKRG
jgi:inhibitor of cysteine peptidase